MAQNRRIVACLLASMLSLALAAGVGCAKDQEEGADVHSGIRFEEDSVTVRVGRSADVLAVFDENWTDYAVQWEADPETTVQLTVPSASIRPNKARVKGLQAGSAVVTATASDGAKATLSVEVTGIETEPEDTPEEGGFTLTQDVVSVALGNTVQFPCTERAGVSFVSEDTSVATVDGSGVITPVAEGVTYVTAAKDGVTLRVKVGAVNSSERSIALTGKTEPRINFYGRGNFDASLGAQMFYFSASGFDVTFFGTELKVNMLRPSSDTYVAYLSVFLDGESMTEVVPLASERVIRLAEKEEREYTLVSGLIEGWHTVKVRKRTAFQRGSTRMDSVGLKELKTDGYFGYCSDKPSLRIDVYGDSYSCGYGNLEDGGSMTSENTDGNLAYHALLANKIGAELNVMAASGWGVYRGNNGSTAWSWVNKYDKLNTMSDEVVQIGGADVIVINLGANDVSGGVFDSADETRLFREAYTQMLHGIREQNPDALILCTYGFVATNTNCKNAIRDVVSSFGDEKVKAYFYTTVRSSTGHPDLANHRSGARELEEVFRQYEII